MQYRCLQFLLTTGVNGRHIKGSLGNGDGNKKSPDCHALGLRVITTNVAIKRKNKERFPHKFASDI